MTRQAGFLDTGDDLLRLTSASCRLDESGALNVDGDGPDVVVGIYGMRFLATDYAGLVDLGWRYDGLDAREADTFAECGIQVRGEALHVVAANCQCLGWSPEKRTLTLRFEIEAMSETHADPLACELSMACLVETAAG